MGSHEEAFHDGNGLLIFNDDEEEDDLDHPTIPYEPGISGQLKGLEGGGEGVLDTWVDSVDVGLEETKSKRNALPPVRSIISDEMIERSSAPPPMAVLAFGSWDGPEDDLADGEEREASRRPSLAPTPSLMPTIKAATNARRRAGIMVVAVVIVLLTGGVVLGITGLPMGILGDLDEEPGAGPMVLVDGMQNASIGGGAAANEGRGPIGRAGSQDGSEAADPSVEGAEEGLDIADGHGTDQDVSETDLGTRQGRILRGSGQIGERSTRGRGRGRSRGQPLDSQQIRVTVGRNSRTIRSCHEREMRRTGMPISQRVNVRIRVARSGVVQNVDVSGGMVTGTPLAACIEHAVRSWRFPEATGETVFETPFVLSPRHI